MPENKKANNTNIENKQNLNEKDLKDVAGGYVNSVQSKWLCPKCGRYEYNALEKYCNYCGYRG